MTPESPSDTILEDARNACDSILDQVAQVFVGNRLLPRSSLPQRPWALATI